MLGVWGGNLRNMHLGKKIICWNLWEDYVAPFWKLRKKKGNLLLCQYLNYSCQKTISAYVGLWKKIKIVEAKWDNDSPKKGGPNKTGWPNL